MKEIPTQKEPSICVHGNFASACKKCKTERINNARSRVEAMYTDYEIEGKERVGVDSELKELVTIFLDMGLETDSSCWGHPERISEHKDLEYGEQNYLPYIGFTGYKEGDGMDDKGKPVGYSVTEVEAACERMQEGAKKIRALLDEFLSQNDFENVWIAFDYNDRSGLPAARLDTMLRSEYNEHPEELTEDVIAEARSQWQQFIEFVKDKEL